MDQQGSPPLSTAGSAAGRPAGAAPQKGGAAPRIDIGTIGVGRAAAEGESRLLAVVAVARFNGVDLSPADYRAAPDEPIPSPASLVAWARDQGLSARAERLRWKQLFKVQGAVSPAPPVVLLFKDGTAGADGGGGRRAQRGLGARPPDSTGDASAVAVDELRLAQAWAGEALLIRRRRGDTEGERPFTLGWLMGLVLLERRSLRDISVGVHHHLSALTIVPPLLVMTVVDRVVDAPQPVHPGAAQRHPGDRHASMRCCWAMPGARSCRSCPPRVDAKLNLHVFNRLLGAAARLLREDTRRRDNYRLSPGLEDTRVPDREAHGHLPRHVHAGVPAAAAVLDGARRSPGSCWSAPVLIAGVILMFLPALRRIITKLTQAESEKGSALVETVHGIRTVKSLALEPQRRAEWDERVAKAGKLKLQSGRLANWPQTLIAPDRVLHPARHHHDRRLHRHAGQHRRRGRRAGGLHDAGRARHAAAGGPGSS